jgi:hypothetical protein
VRTRERESGTERAREKGSEGEDGVTTVLILVSESYPSHIRVISESYPSLIQVLSKSYPSRDLSSVFDRKLLLRRRVLRAGNSSMTRVRLAVTRTTLFIQLRAG